MMVKEPTAFVRIRKSDKQAITEAARRFGWFGAFPELFNRYHEMLRHAAEMNQPKPARRAKQSGRPLAT